MVSPTTFPSEEYLLGRDIKYITILLRSFIANGTEVNQLSQVIFLLLPETGWTNLITKLLFCCWYEMDQLVVDLRKPLDLWHKSWM